MEPMVFNGGEWPTSQVFTINDLRKAGEDVRKHGRVAVAILVKPSIWDAIKDTIAGDAAPEGFVPDHFRGCPIRATLPEAWHEPFRIVYEGDPIHQGWKLFGGATPPMMEKK